MNALDPSAVIPIRMVGPGRRSWRDGLGAGVVECAVSLLANAAVLAGLVHVAFPRDIPVQEPNAISVDLVSEPAPKGGGPGKASSAAPAKASAGAGDVKASPAAAPVATTEAKPETSDAKATEAKAESKPSTPAPPKSEPKPERAIPASAPTPDAQHPAARTEPASAGTPPPVDAGPDPTPRLVQAPADPRLAAQQSDKNMPANAELKPAQTASPAEVPPPPSPEVVVTANADAEPVPQPESTASSTAPATAVTAESLREAENTAKLAAALPFSQSYVAAPNRAALSGAGQSDSQNFRGAVYGNFRKADDLVEEARAKHLHGQAVVLFSIDDKGGLVSAKIALSSGDPAVDETALEIIRRAAPFPPPPPGAPHVFSPAIGFGQETP